MADSTTPSLGGSSRSETVRIVSAVTLALTTVFVASRLVSRFILVKSRTWDDWFIILAWAFAFGVSFSIIWGTTKGLGSHDVDIKDGWLPELRRSEYVFTVLYVSQIVCVPMGCADMVIESSLDGHEDIDIDILLTHVKEYTETS
jgi:hypothetical protein